MKIEGVEKWRCSGSTNYMLNDVKKYYDYLNLLSNLTENYNFLSFHKSVEGKIGYPVSSLRALELVMFLNTGTQSMFYKL